MRGTSNSDLGAIRRNFLNRVTSERFGSNARSGQFSRLLDDVTRAATTWADRNGLSQEQLEDLLSDVFDLVVDLQSATGNLSVEAPTQEIWTRHERPFALIKRSEGVPTIYRAELEHVVGAYLRKSWRSSSLDRVLVDVLVAAELYAFGTEMFGKAPKWLKGFSQSPLHQRHAVVQLLTTIFTNLLLIAGLFAIGVWAATSWVWWVVLTMIALVLVSQVLGVALLPVVWRQQTKQRKRVQDLMSAMLDVYAKLGSGGPASAAFVRKQCEDASSMGVVWPSSLFALLDDILKRGGTFG